MRMKIFYLRSQLWMCDSYFLGKETVIIIIFIYDLTYLISVIFFRLH